MTQNSLEHTTDSNLGSEYLQRKLLRAHEFKDATQMRFEECLETGTGIEPSLEDPVDGPKMYHCHIASCGGKVLWKNRRQHAIGHGLSFIYLTPDDLTESNKEKLKVTYCPTRKRTGCDLFFLNATMANNHTIELTYFRIFSPFFCHFKT